MSSVVIGVIVAVVVLTTIVVTESIIGVVQMLRMERNMTTLAECLLTYMTRPEDIDIIEDYTTTTKTTDWNFPNTDGGFQ